MSPADLQKMQSNFMARGAPQARPSALQEVQAGLNAGKTITEGYKTGKSALFGAAPTPDDKEGLRGLFANTGKPEIKGGWLDTIKGWGSSATPAARGGVMGYAGGGMPYGDDDTDSTDILGDVVKQGQQHASLPKPGEAPKAPQSGVGQLAQGVGALNSGMKAAQGLYTGAGKLGSLISGLGSAAEGAGAAAAGWQREGRHPGTSSSGRGSGTRSGNGTVLASCSARDR
jgi:X-X-X-Leu-X-X-Gly heptad repeat protein